MPCILNNLVWKEISNIIEASKAETIKKTPIPIV